MSGLYTAAEYAAAKESWAYWTSVGCDDLHAACLLGDEDGETSFRLGAVGDHDTAFGPFQHHLTRIVAIDKGCGIDIRTAPHVKQLEAAHWEMTKGAYRKVWPLFTAATSIMNAIAVLVHDYEGSANQESDIMKRVDHASYWLEYARENWSAEA
jgi:hypothetical protein